MISSSHQLGNLLLLSHGASHLINVQRNRNSFQIDQYNSIHLNPPFQISNIPKQWCFNEIHTTCYHRFGPIGCFIFIPSSTGPDAVGPFSWDDGRGHCPWAQRGTWWHGGVPSTLRPNRLFRFSAQNLLFVLGKQMIKRRVGKFLTSEKYIQII